MKKYALLPAIVLMGPLSSCNASADTGNMMTRAEDMTCKLRLDFSEETEIEKWRTVLDGVMGGRSTGVRFAEDSHMIFKGRINTNGGGFSSLRRSMTPESMTGAQTVRLRLRQDGRAYKMTFRTTSRQWGRPISYQLNIPKTDAGVWTDITLPLSGFRTSIFGREVKSPPFDPAKVREIGIIIADGIDGPFQIDVKKIACS